MNAHASSPGPSQDEALLSASPGWTAAQAAVERACARIAPTWPLDRFIAVNPFWHLVDGTVADAAARLQALSGAQLLMPRAWYRDAYREGRFGDAHLRAALAESGADVSLARLRQLLEEREPPGTQRLQVVDLIDQTRDLDREMSWRTFVTTDISQFCAAFFDEGQASFAPPHEGGLYASWWRHARDNHSPALLMGARTYRTFARDLPADPRELVARNLAALAIPPEQQESYLWSLLLAQNGWASWCAYRRWQARLEGRDDGALVDLLAIRLAWEGLLYRLGGARVASGWSAAVASWPQIDAHAATARADDWLFQRAMERAWCEPLLRAMPAGLSQPRPRDVEVQAVFCIDVRSEVFRRAFEASAPSVQTLGFAGFFGIPLAYQPLAAEHARPQLPGLLAPRLRVADARRSTEAEAHESRAQAQAEAWQAFRGDPLSTFAFVDAWGLGYAVRLVREAVGAAGTRAPVPPPLLLETLQGAPLDIEARCDLAAGMLRGMSLTQAFAPLVLLVGHGSETRNNAHAAGLDCGACCGQTGEINARIAASLLNEPQVREGLASRGITIPAETWFVPALHNTTSDEITLFDASSVPASRREKLATVKGWLAAASERTRAERAERFALTNVASRTKDWAQVRPEWGLVGNAGFIVAPREHVRHLNLEGRVFLHEYRHEEDPTHAVLELILTAPMVVTHWINFQYYASTVDNRRYGSGNKILHNVVGGHLGVFEGNTGDLRIGLSLESLHDGQRWVHEPLRLSVFVEAPRAAIDAILAKHATVRHLVEHGWLALFQLDEKEGAIHARRQDGWHRESGVTSDARGG